MKATPNLRLQLVGPTDPTSTPPSDADSGCQMTIRFPWHSNNGMQFPDPPHHT